METSGSEQFKGEKLVETLVNLTGLPREDALNEVGQILSVSGADAGTLSIDELRQAMLMYLESIDAGMCAGGFDRMTEDLNQEEIPPVSCS